MLADSEYQVGGDWRLVRAEGLARFSRLSSVGSGRVGLGFVGTA